MSKFVLEIHQTEHSFKVELFHLYTCLGHSNAVFILLVMHKYTCKNTSSVYVIVHG